MPLAEEMPGDAVYAAPQQLSILREEMRRANSPCADRHVVSVAGPSAGATSTSLLRIRRSGWPHADLRRALVTFPRNAVVPRRSGGHP